MYYNLISLMPKAAGYDADAQAYFNANTVITSTADKNAINSFYLGLKSDGIYSNIKAMYLPIWGSASASKFNLINPADTNAAFRLTFASGWTYSTSGIRSNGATYANTFFNMSTQITSVNNWSVGFYSNLWGSGGVDFGADTGANNFYLTTKSPGIFGANTARMQFNDALNFTDTTGIGFYLGSRISSTNGKIYKNGSQVGNLNNASAGSFANLNVYLGALNRSGTASFGTNVRYSFAFIANSSFSATDVSNFYSRVQTLMTYFAIQV